MLSRKKKNTSPNKGFFLKYHAASPLFHISLSFLQRLCSAGHSQVRVLLHKPCTSGAYTEGAV